MRKAATSGATSTKASTNGDAWAADQATRLPEARRVLVQGEDTIPGRGLALHAGRGPGEPDPLALRDVLEAARLLEVCHLQPQGRFELTEQDPMDAALEQIGIDAPGALDGRFRNSSDRGMRSSSEPVSLGNGRQESYAPSC